MDQRSALRVVDKGTGAVRCNLGRIKLMQKRRWKMEHRRPRSWCKAVWDDAAAAGHDGGRKCHTALRLHPQGSWDNNILDGCDDGHGSGSVLVFAKDRQVV